MRFRSFFFLFIFLILLGSMKVRAQTVDFNDPLLLRLKKTNPVFTVEKSNVKVVKDIFEDEKKTESPIMRKKDPSEYGFDPEKIQSLSPKPEETGISSELAETVKLYASIGSFLDMRTRAADRWSRDTRYVSTSMSIEVGENWYVRTGLYMNGWDNSEVGPKVVDAIIKFAPQNAVGLAGYSPVVGVERYFGKRRRGKVSFLYGTVPPASGVTIIGKDSTPRQFRISGSIVF